MMDFIRTGMTQQVKVKREDEVVTLIPHFPSLSESLALFPCFPGCFAAQDLAGLAGELVGPMHAHLNPVAERAGDPGSWVLPSVVSRVRWLCGLLVTSSVQLAFLLPNVRPLFPVASFLSFLPNEWRHPWGCERWIWGTGRCSVTHMALRPPADGTGLNSRHPARGHCGTGAQQPQVSLDREALRFRVRHTFPVSLARASEAHSYLCVCVSVYACIRFPFFLPGPSVTSLGTVAITSQH